MDKIKLLVVDDIPQTRKDIIRLLYFEDDMVVVGEAADGKEALQKMGELLPDVVLMDINMPMMDGITATERACHLHPQVAVVIISIQGESEYLKKAMVAGARDYLVKPLGSDEMANTIRSVYKQQRLRMKLPALPPAVQAPAMEPVQPKPDAQPFPSVSHHDRAAQPAEFQHTQAAPQTKAVFPKGKDEQELSLQERVQALYRQLEMNQNSIPLPQQQDAHFCGTIPPHSQFNPLPAPPVFQEASSHVETVAGHFQEGKRQPDHAGNRIITESVKQENTVRPPVEKRDALPLGMVYVVFCGKGGVGKTTIATNLAVTIAQQEKKKVALVDYDLQFGDISVLLNLADGKNISDLVQENDKFTDELLENAMIRHFTGIDILPAPLFPQDAEYITADHTDQILRLLKKNYDYIVVDTAATFNEINLQALDLADQILLVTTRDIITIKNTKTSLNILDSLDYRGKIRVVLNRGDQDLGVDVADLEKGLEITVSHQISGDEKAVISAINKGVPVVVSQANAEISKSFKRLCERLTTGRRAGAAEKQSRGIITRMFSL